MEGEEPAKIELRVRPPGDPDLLSPQVSNVPEFPRSFLPDEIDVLHTDGRCKDADIFPIERIQDDRVLGKRPATSTSPRSIAELRPLPGR